MSLMIFFGENRRLEKIQFKIYDWNITFLFGREWERKTSFRR